MSKNNSHIEVENHLYWRGRVVTGWWDGEPIHREMTIDEKAIRDRIKPEVATLGMLLLSNPNFKP